MPCRICWQNVPGLPRNFLEQLDQVPAGPEKFPQQPPRIQAVDDDPADERLRLSRQIEFRVQGVADRFRGGQGLDHQKNIRRDPQAVAVDQFQKDLEKGGDGRLLQGRVKRAFQKVGEILLQGPAVGFFVVLHDAQKDLGDLLFVAAKVGKNQIGEILPGLAVHAPHHAEIEVADEVGREG